ncbi:MAG: sigma-70 family RNA polymerase sigma factor [Acidobacteria bacterium]|nr:sigma-70 family RNA polymerase sigma factor [Acidobacteriota bacterium]
MNQPEITELLHALHNGNQDAWEQLTPLVYDNLKKIAHNRLRRERNGHTLQSTEIIGELYLRLMGDERDWKGRTHFYAHCSVLMRNILVEWARSRPRRIGVREGQRVTFDKALVVAAGEEENIIVQIHDALKDLEKLYPRQARVVELKFFGGLTNEEVGTVLGYSSKSIGRDWKFAQTWLKRQIGGALPHDFATTSTHSRII